MSVLDTPLKYLFFNEGDVDEDFVKKHLIAWQEKGLIPDMRYRIGMTKPCFKNGFLSFFQELGTLLKCLFEPIFNIDYHSLGIGVVEFDCKITDLVSHLKSCLSCGRILPELRQNLP